MRKLLITISVALTIQGYSQENISIGMEAAYTNDLYTHFDANRFLISVPLPNGAFGVTLRKELTGRIFLEGGLSSKSYSEGIGFDQIPVWIDNLAFHAVLIPIRVGYKIKFIKGFQIVPSGSLLTAIRTTPLDPAMGFGSISNINFNYSQKEVSDPFFFMTELRLALEKRIKNSFRISLFYSRTFGFETVNELDVEYSINGTPYQGQYVSKGDYWSVGVGIAYLLKPKTKVE